FEFRRQLEYKAERRGGRVVVADRWFPSSKTCSECGAVQDKMPLSVRQWICPDCGTIHDRDVNAARNLRPSD
ncbi:MAG: RNA-guided endonuclease InsQ/TnpB family protein, partial [Leptospirales bacterium]